MRSLVITVTTTAQLIVDTSNLGHAAYPGSAVILVPVAGSTVFVGGSDVTSVNGFPLTPTASAPVSLEWDYVNDAMFAIVAGGTQDVNVLRRAR